MSENIIVHEPDDTIYTMNGYGRIRTFAVNDDGSIAEMTTDNES